MIVTRQRSGLEPTDTRFYFTYQNNKGRLRISLTQVVIASHLDFGLRVDRIRHLWREGHLGLRGTVTDSRQHVLTFHAQKAK